MMRRCPQHIINYITNNSKTIFRKVCNRNSHGGRTLQTVSVPAAYNQFLVLCCCSALPHNILCLNKYTYTLYTMYIQTLFIKQHKTHKYMQNLHTKYIYAHSILCHYHTHQHTHIRLST